ncbi:uncharacterized protein [Euwallacea fornicatus]|uniref:uncharacterized protein n=1 Tax=Euwallacea fornicatus TaxID=995702 RepID=UPI00338FC1B7
MDSGLYAEARKRKKNDRYLIGLIFGALLCKLVLFPLAVKAMAVMSSVSVLMSALGLIVSSIVGYGKLPAKTEPEEVIRIHHVRNGGWGKVDLELPKGYIPPIPIDYEISKNISP